MARRRADRQAVTLRDYIDARMADATSAFQERMHERDAHFNEREEVNKERVRLTREVLDKELAGHQDRLRRAEERVNELAGDKVDKVVYNRALDALEDRLRAVEAVSRGERDVEGYRRWSVGLVTAIGVGLLGVAVTIIHILTSPS